MIFSFTGTKTENAAYTLLQWCAAFGLPAGFLPDGATNFKNETLRLLPKSLRIPHHFRLRYSPWSNSAVERLGREIIRTTRAMLLGLQLTHEHSTNLLSIVQSALTNTRSRHRGNHAPTTSFTGLPPSAPIQIFIRPDSGTRTIAKDIPIKRCLDIEQVQQQFNDLHPVISNVLAANRKRSRDAAEREHLANFTERNFVLLARETFYIGEKLCLRWQGPHRVLKAVNDYVYFVEDQRNGRIQEDHATRLDFNSDFFLDTKAILPQVISSESGMQVQKLLRFTENPTGCHVVIRRKGLPTSKDTQEL